MSLQENLEKIAGLAETVASHQGLVLVDVRFGQVGGKRSLKVTIFRPGGSVSLDDCQAVSRELERQLDRQDKPLVEGAFLLEVESPGIDRELITDREFKVFIGQTVEVRTRETIGSLGAAFQGTLMGSAHGKITIGNPKPLPVRTSAKPRPGSDRQRPVQTQEHEFDLDLKKLVRIKLYPAEIYSGGKLPPEKHR